MDEALHIMDEVIKGGAKWNKRLVFCRNLLEIWQAGKCSLLFQTDDNVSKMQMKYIKAFFLLQRKL